MFGIGLNAFVHLIRIIMRIGFAVDRFREDVGMANVVFNLAKQLSETDEVTVITFEDALSDSLAEKCREKKIKIETVKRSSWLGFYKDIREKSREIDRMNLDIISIHGFMLANAAAISDTETLKTNHAHCLIKEEWRRNPLRLPIWVLEEVPSVLLADRTISISKYARNQYRKLYRKDSEVIYNGIDPEDYKPVSEEENKFEETKSDDKVTLGTLCMLRDYKNIKLVLEALEDTDREYEYFIGGKGPQKGDLKQIVNENDIDATFLGFVDEKHIAEFYSMLDLFLFPSKWEGFGVPVLESLACNTPVAAVDQKGPKEIITDNTGYLLSKDPEDWRSAIEDFKSDQFGDEPRERAENFSWDETSNEYREKIKEITST